MSNEIEKFKKQYEKEFKGLSPWITLAGITCLSESFIDYLDVQLESLRLSHEETTEQLRALEDAIAMCFELVDSEPVTYRTKPHNYVIVNDTVDPLSNAIKNSRARKQG